MSIDKTVQGVFDKAMYLIDAQNESTGATQTSDTQEYKVRTIGILNNLLDEVFPASDTFAFGDDGKRPALPDIAAFTDVLDLDAAVCRNILPLGLAAKLLSEENPSLADYFQQRYEEMLKTAMHRVPSTFESIDDVAGGMYGIMEHREFGFWS